LAYVNARSQATAAVVWRRGLISVSDGGQFAFPWTRLSGGIGFIGRAYTCGKGRVVGSAVSQIMGSSGGWLAVFMGVSPIWGVDKRYVRERDVWDVKEIEFFESIWRYGKGWRGRYTENVSGVHSLE
jgi:hypothetical protein